MTTLDTRNNNNHRLRLPGAATSLGRFPSCAAFDKSHRHTSAGCEPICVAQHTWAKLLRFGHVTHLHYNRLEGAHEYMFHVARSEHVFRGASRKVFHTNTHIPNHLKTAAHALNIDFLSHQKPTHMFHTHSNTQVLSRVRPHAGRDVRRPERILGHVRAAAAVPTAAVRRAGRHVHG